jgi:glucuronoarabinoxylan endo-1,4-beta-xylanase
MIRRQHAFLGLLLLGATALPSACTLPFAYVDDGSGGEAGAGNEEDGSGAAVGSGAAGPSGGGTGNDGSGAAPGGGGSGAGGATSGGGGAEDGGSGGAGPDSGGGGSGGSLPSGVVVVLDAEHQTIQGFGISTAMSPSVALPYDDLFTTDGPSAIGLSILRVGMNTNGSLTGHGIDEAMAVNPELKVIGTTWSPPGSWKNSGTTVDGGHLLLEYYDDWAETIAQFAFDNELYAMSIAHAPDFASCPTLPICTDSYDTTLYTAEEMVEFVKAARMAFDVLSPDTKIIAPEAMEWNHAWSNLSATGSAEPVHPTSSDPLACGCFSNTITAAAEADCAPGCAAGAGYDYGHWLWDDQAAWASFDIFGVQEYDSQMAYAWPADVNGGVRDKEVWMTEMSGILHWPEEGPSTDIDNGIAVAGWIHSALTVGEASAWVWWWYEAYYADDNEGLALIDNDTTIAKRYYTLGNYSKFVRPGFVAVEVVGNDNEDVLLSAYKGSSGEVVVVAINRAAADVSLPISFAAGTAPGALTPYVTSADDNLAAGAEVLVSDDAFMAALPALSVTTFAGD